MTHIITHTHIRVIRRACTSISQLARACLHHAFSSIETVTAALRGKAWRCIVLHNRRSLSLSRDNYHRRTLAGRVRRIYSCIHGKMIASLMSRSACTRCVTLYIFSLYLCIARHARNSSNSRRALASDKNIARAPRRHRRTRTRYIVSLKNSSSLSFSPSAVFYIYVRPLRAAITYSEKFQIHAPASIYTSAASVIIKANQYSDRSEGSRHRERMGSHSRTYRGIERRLVLYIRRSENLVFSLAYSLPAHARGNHLQWRACEHTRLSEITRCARGVQRGREGRWRR